DFYELEPSTDIVFGPSGTDMEYMVNAIAMQASPEGIHNVILGANEVASGIKYAAKGQFFSPVTPTRNEQEVGSYVEGFDLDRISSASVPIRNGSGEVYSDEQITAYL